MSEDSKSHRPVITGSHGMASTGHPLASCEAIYVLKKGGSAMDAALAAAAVLAVVKSYHCGLGGDVFALYFSAREQKLYCLNGSGKSPYLLKRELYSKKIPERGRSQQAYREQSMRGHNWQTDLPPVAWQNCGSRRLITPPTAFRYFLISRG